MTVANTYHRKKHGNTARECRECTRLAAKKRNVYGYTRGEQVELAKHEVEVEDTSEMKVCPKCSGILKWGNDTRLEDAVWCVYCGWRPSARVGNQA
jgi:DNA-directed RNA polymerase subunit M/transcription elongation factor TFIIS